MDDTITKLLRGVARGEISVDDARKSLEDASLTEEQLSLIHISEPTRQP